MWLAVLNLPQKLLYVEGVVWGGALPLFVCFEIDVGVGFAVGSIRADGHIVGGCVVVRVGCVMVVVFGGWY